MSFSSWDIKEIDKVCRIRRGASPRPIQDYIKETGIPWVKISDATASNSRFIESTSEFIKEEGRDKSRYVEKGTLILSNSATPGIPKFMGIDACVHDGWLIIDEFKNITNEFLFYTLINEKEKLLNLSNGSVFRNLKTDIVKSYKIKIPLLKEQKAIAKILSTIDEKIEVNNKINKTLESIAQELFKRWFVDFEFPNEDGEPYKSNGGEMVESELGMIPVGWHWGTLNDVLEFYDSKRVPLSSKQRDNMEKLYPYYGAASLVDFVDDYIFDGIYVLVSEDGANVVDEKGYPLVQYVWGKFWVNNHAHIIKGKNGYSEQSVYILLKNTNMQAIVTGAVQPKINQANLKSVRVLIPTQSTIKKFNIIVDHIFNQYRLLYDQNKVLIQLRDSLLPKLMSGKIRVPIED